ncbi:MAG: hypothetical protein KC800_05930 [Candidatus Eremiobacteraeota bacterium]|nr:hypothetical protein [Candidatus Eremiobacteraeota bacterium]
MKIRASILSVVSTLAIMVAGTTSDAEARPGARGSVRYSGSSSVPVTYQKPMNTPGYSAARQPTSPNSVPTSYQRPMNTGPGERAYRRASDYYYYPGSAGYIGDGYDYSSDPQPAQSTAAPTYRPAAPPETGGVISRLPSGFGTASLAGKDYYYSQGIYYVRNQQNYEAVPPPVGLTVAELPPGASQVKTGLYQYRDVYYRPAYDGGNLAYVVSNP